MTREELFDLSQKIAKEQMETSFKESSFPENMPIPKEILEFMFSQIFHISASVSAQLIYEYDKNKK